jgi:excinuclease ABC subunit C
MKSKFDGQTDIAELKHLPETPGVYFFLGEKEVILYIGKATVLRDRVRSYFAKDMLFTRGPKIVKMLSLAQRVAWTSTDSVLEALLLESRLIKDHQPTYNTDAKDDKSFNHVVITDEEFPRVLLVRGHDLSEGKFTFKVRSMYGPFPHGTELRTAMKIVRSIFPFRDKCSPTDNRQPTTDNNKPKPCFHRQIGLCPGVCMGEISARAYGSIIRNIERFFEGKKKSIAEKLEKEMMREARRLHFERAGEIKRTLFALRHIEDVALLTDNRKPTTDNGGGIRIEAYDVAHTMGQASVGVMTVVEGGRLNKDEYRLFNLRGNHQGNDLSALEELLSRRLKHREWRTPDIVAVDGNFLQLGVAEKLFSQETIFQPLLLGVVKDSHHKPKDILHLPAGLANLRGDILLANGEAHRFAIRHHRVKRGKEFLNTD